MKKYITGMLVMLIFALYPKAETLTHCFKFSESEFRLATGSGDSLSITSLRSPSIFPDKTQPGLPIINRNIALPGNSYIADWSATVYKHSTRTGVNIANATVPLPTSMLNQPLTAANIGYPTKTYPDTICALSSVDRFGSAKVAAFFISPFVYDAANRELFFVDSIVVTMTLANDGIYRAPGGMPSLQFSMLNEIVENGDALNDIPIIEPDYPEEESYEYLIITSSSLKNAFRPLAEWKRKKGVRSKIITVEEINLKYADESLLARIKRCIFDERDNYGVRFVLLGGDTNIIPALKCTVQIVTYSNEGNVISALLDSIPTDLYYACSTDYDWDPNGDNYVGGLSDQVNYQPEVAVTRVPVTISTDATNFVNRIIEYEQTPKIFTFDLFQAGAILLRAGSYIYPGEDLADLLFNEVFNNKIILGHDKFFDTYTYNNTPFNISNFTNELCKGYAYAEIITHGGTDSWEFDTYGKFKVNNAANFNNDWHTLITTMACHTNAFDGGRYSSELNTCLSEALIRNPNSGIIGYLGSTREGWFVPNAVDYSMTYEVQFYDRLLNNDRQPHVKHFGELLNCIKRSLLIISRNDVHYRWLYYSINAIGDPETPLYNRLPREFMDVKVEVGLDGCIKVDPGFENARICVSSSTGGNYYCILNGRNQLFNPPQGTYDIWITMPGYKPWHYRVCTEKQIIDPDLPIIPAYPYITSITPNPATSYVTINYRPSIHGPQYKVSLVPVNGSQVYYYPLDDNATTIDISNIPAGVYVVTIFMGDTAFPMNSQRLIKQ